jgi:hypothetical protein
MTRSRHILPPREYWSEEEIAWLRLLYPHVKTTRLADAFERTERQVYKRAARMGLRKTSEYLESPDACRLRRGGNVGAANRFPKGHVPANKGLRRPGYAPGRMAETQFKRGQRNGKAAEQHMPIGATRLVDGYEYTKVSDVPSVPWTRNWKPSHRLLWERHFGAIPPRHVITFRNGNRADIRIDNLECISQREHRTRNSIHNLPAPLKEVVQIRAGLVRRIHNRQRKAREETP